MQSLDAATAIDRSGRPTPIWAARQPLPKTARYRPVVLRRPVVPRWNGARGSRVPYLARADGPRTTLTLHADLAIPSTPDDDAGWAAARGWGHGPSPPCGLGAPPPACGGESGNQATRGRVSGADRGARSASGSAPRRPGRHI